MVGSLQLAVLLSKFTLPVWIPDVMIIGNEHGSVLMNQSSVIIWVMSSVGWEYILRRTRLQCCRLRSA